MSTAFVNISFENKRFMNGLTFTSSTFGITVELVMLLPWNLLPLPWKFVYFPLHLQFCFARLHRLFIAICFYPPHLRCCCWNEGPDQKGLLLSSSFRKTFLELFFDLTNSVKWSLNYFPKRFSSLVCSNSTLFFNMFFCLLRRTHAQ